MNNEMIERLKAIARQKCFYDDDDEDVTVNDYAGGNVDDAFSTGETAGEVMLARSILEDLNISWVEVAEGQGVDIVVV